MIFKKAKCLTYDENSVKMFEGFWKNNINLIKPSNIDAECCFLSMANNVHIWHKRLGHVKFNQLENLSKKNLVVGLPKISIKQDIKYTTCLKNKMVSVSHKSKNVISATRPLKLLHLDLFSPTIRVFSLGRSKYGLIILDDFSRLTWVLFLRNKYDTFDTFQKFVI